MYISQLNPTTDIINYPDQGLPPDTFQEFAQ